MDTKKRKIKRRKAHDVRTETLQALREAEAVLKWLFECQAQRQVVFSDRANEAKPDINEALNKLRRAIKLNENPPPPPPMMGHPYD